LLFTPTKAGIVNLIKEGFCEDNKGPYSPDNPGIFLSGDVMYDNSIYFSAIAAQHSAILKENGLVPEGFALVTIHRDFNTDNPQNLTNIFTALQEVTEKYPFELFVPLHPRTAKILGTVLPESLYSKIISNTKIKLAGPVSFFDMIELEKNCAIVITDSGGVQKEAYFFKKPCVILRPETEWIELVENGNAILAGSDPEKIAEGLRLLYGNTGLTYPELYGDGRTSEKICDVVLKGIKK
jgi:UDP-GlcNAc3NAcA epimerase